MKELQLSDAELAGLLAPAIRQRLKDAGFHTGAGEGVQCTVALPVNLDMAGSILVERSEEGVWTFRQELNVELADRTDHAHGSNVAAVANLITSVRET